MWKHGAEEKPAFLEFASNEEAGEKLEGFRPQQLRLRAGAVLAKHARYMDRHQVDILGLNIPTVTRASARSFPSVTLFGAIVVNCSYFEFFWLS